MLQKKKEGMKWWILLDRESTTDIFREYKYLTNIKTVPTTLKIMNNGGLLKKINREIRRTTGIYGIIPKL